MKRLISAFCLLSVLIFYNWFAERYTIDFCRKLDAVLETCSAQIKEKNYSQAESTVSKLYNLWEENDIILGVFIGDDSVVEPQKTIISIQLSLRDENYEKCLISIRDCQGCLHEIIENNSTNFGNVL